MITRLTVSSVFLICVAALAGLIDQVASRERTEDLQAVVGEARYIELAQNTKQTGKQKKAKQKQGKQKQGKQKSKQRQAQPRTTPPTTPRATAPTRRGRRSTTLTSRRRSMSNVPNMFGDFFGGGTSLLTLGGQSMDVQQIFNDGDPIDLLVTNLGQSLFGADNDPTTQIFIQDGGVIIARSIQPGIDGSNDTQADTYEIDEPLGSAPDVPDDGTTVTYLGGQAVFVAVTGRNLITQPSDDSIGQGDGWNLIFAHRITQPSVTVFLPPGGGSAVRRQKVSENNSPLPRNRFIFNYHFFNDVRGGIGDVNRYTVGWEAMLVPGMSSFEFRVPFAGTLSSQQVAGFSARDTELGNMSMIFKQVVYETDAQVWSAGLGINIPTARDTVVTLPGAGLITRWKNSSTHLLPYIATVGTPTDDIFWQGFVQMDFDTTGNRIDADSTGVNATPIGVVQDPNLLFLDFSIGRWLIDDPDASFITGVAPMLELHYATTVQDAETITGNGVTVSGQSQRIDILNASAAAVIRIHDRMTIRPGIVFPLRRNHDKQFDFEAGIQVNLY